MPGSSSVFFSNVPMGSSEESLLGIFERAGRVVSLRLMESRKKNAPFPSMVGFCDYADELAAQAAVASLNGYDLTPTAKLSVKMGDRKRDRDDAATQVVDDNSVQFVQGSMLAAPGDPVQVALNGIPVAQLYEAVEQLRVLSIEQPNVARDLLQSSPQLRYAVVLVLQHAKRVPLALPQDAFSGTSAPAAAEEAAAAPEASSASTSGADAAVKAVEQLSEAELQQIMALSPEDLAALDAPTRAHLTALQTELLRLLQ